MPSLTAACLKELLRLPADADLTGSFSDLGVDIIGGTPDDFAAYIKSEIPKWTAIIKASGAKLE